MSNRLRKYSRGVAKSSFRSKNRRYLPVEFKYADSFKADSTIVAEWAGAEMDPAANTLCAPTKGTGPSNRDGDRICITSIHVRGHIRFALDQDATDSVSATPYVILLVQDCQTNGAQLNAEDVMVDTSPQENTFRNLQYSSRFKILKVWRGVISQTSAMTDGANTASLTGDAQCFGCDIKCRIPVNFSANAGSVADITDNSLHIIGCARAAVLTYTYATRVRFVG